MYLALPRYTPSAGESTQRITDVLLIFPLLRFVFPWVLSSLLVFSPSDLYTGLVSWVACGVVGFSCASLET